MRAKRLPEAPNRLHVALLALVILVAPMRSSAQDKEIEFPPTLPILLDQMRELESNRDPKCYATAARLENFMYGTPLTEEARFRKTELQKSLITRLWHQSSEESEARGETQVDLATLSTWSGKVLTYQKTEAGDVDVRWQGGSLRIAKRDIEHYSSIAYAYRALLAVQQEFLLAPKPVLPLSVEGIEHLRSWLDVLTLAALHTADQNSRRLHEREISAALFQNAWEQMTQPAVSWSGPETDVRATAKSRPDFALVDAIVAEKLASYEAYNQISMPVFMRNLQVYFARFQWPRDEEQSEQIKIAFNESMIHFVADTLRDSSRLARERGQPLIRVDDVHEALQSFAPYTVNEYEDVIYFPNLPSADRVVLESYDTDSFRDSGLHWRYLQEAIDEIRDEPILEPDPFASELIVEGVAQFGVLILRVAGRAGQAEAAETLTLDHLRKAFQIVQRRIDEHAKTPAPKKIDAQVVSRSAETSRTDSFFADVTEESGIVFEHRSSDWLSRTLRSYLRKTESEGTLTIPPAFGGAGVAAEDLNRDGLADVLLLSGLGNRLYVNKGDGTFEDVTITAPIDFRRPDNHAGEPRQPIIADFDNDGFPDILITYVDDDHRLYRNRGDFVFEDVTESAGLGGKGLVGGPATACDINNDGLLDLYIGYFGDYLKGILPNLSRRNLNALPNRLYLNQGDFHFKDVTAGSGTDNTGWTQAMSHTDIDGDGWQDLIVGNDFGVNVYLRNLGNGKFEDITDAIGAGKPSFTMNVGIADLNADDYPDIYISNIVTMVKDEKYVLPSAETEMRFNPSKLARMRVIEANDLFMSGPGEKGLPRYTLSDAVGRGFSATGWSWDADFFDFDLDGDDDLYCLNGMNEYMVYSDTPYYSSVGELVAQIVLPVSEREPNVFFLNQGGRLEYASDASGVDFLGNSRSAAYLDIENDGDLDIVVNNYHGPALVYRNQSERFGNHWIKIKLVGNPERGSNRDAIGARMIVTGPNGLRVWREIHGTEGYLSVHPREQHFGVGDEELVDLTILWPNGEKQVVKGLQTNQRYELIQE